MFTHPLWPFDDLAHCQLAPLTPPSGSLSSALISAPTLEKLTHPASSRLPTVTVMVCSEVIARSAVPPVAVTVTMYSLFAASLRGSVLATSAGLS